MRIYNGKKELYINKLIIRSHSWDGYSDLWVDKLFINTDDQGAEIYDHFKKYIELQIVVTKEGVVTAKVSNLQSSVQHDKLTRIEYIGVGLTPQTDVGARLDYAIDCARNPGSEISIKK